ncbi:tyrosine-type recombinase/integrase [Lachnospiraceae bacterium 54-53]
MRKNERPVRMITEEAIEEYCSWMYCQEKCPVTIKKYRYYLDQFRFYMEGRNVSKEAVILWKAGLRKTLSPVTANGALAAVNGFFKYRGWPDLCTKFYKVSSSVFCPEQKELSKEEYKRLVRAAKSSKNERLTLILQTICSSGIRISELPFITVEAVENGVADVECKGRIRKVFLTRPLCDLLKKYTEAHNIISGMIFVTRTGKALDRSNIWREMKALGKSAGVAEEKIFPHNLRHLFARTFYMMERDLSRLADILGHSDVNTTRIYTRESGHVHLKILEQLDLLVTQYNGIPLLL